MPSLLGIDSGLTVTKAVLFDVDGTTLAVARRRVAQSFPRPRHVERDMDEFWNATADAIAEAIAKSGRPASDVLAIATTAHGDGIYMLDKDRRRRYRPVAPCVGAIGHSGMGEGKRAGTLPPHRPCDRLQGLAALLSHR